MKKLLSSISDGRGFDIALVAFPLAFLFVMAGLPLLLQHRHELSGSRHAQPGTFVRPFVGFKNYVDLFRQPETWPILMNTVVTFVVASIAGQFVIGFGLALFFWVNFPVTRAGACSSFHGSCPASLSVPSGTGFCPATSGF